MDMSSSADDGLARRDTLDIGHLTRQTMGDAGLERELLQLFARHSVVLMGRIEAGTPDDRFVAAHTLKGSARAIGAWTVADAAAAVEVAGGSLEGLRTALDRACAAIEARLADGPA